jgi:hypothetical protein
LITQQDAHVWEERDDGQPGNGDRGWSPSAVWMESSYHYYYHYYYYYLHTPLYRTVRDVLDEEQKVLGAR